MSEPIQIAEPVEEPKVWLFIEVMRSEMETVLNEKAKDGYQVYRMDRINENRLVSYDIVLFNPVLLSTKHATALQQAMAKVGLDVGSASTAGSKTP